MREEEAKQNAAKTHLLRRCRRRGRVRSEGRRGYGKGRGGVGEKPQCEAAAEKQAHEGVQGRGGEGVWECVGSFFFGGVFFGFPIHSHPWSPAFDTEYCNFGLFFCFGLCCCCMFEERHRTFVFGFCKTRVGVVVESVSCCLLFASYFFSLVLCVCVASGATHTSGATIRKIQQVEFVLHEYNIGVTNAVRMFVSVWG